MGGRGSRIAALLAVIALAAALRVALLDRQGLWSDEIFSLAIATGHSLEHPAAEADPAQGDYVEAARARGISERNVVRRHAFRNALVPVITVIGLQVALTLSGAILTERTFNWPGLGTELVQYVTARDYIAVQGLVTFFALVVVVVSLLVDIINALVDPRVRY